MKEPALSTQENTKTIAARADQIRACGGFDPDCTDIPSPCISVCRMTADRSHCEGCFRTLDEIRAWSKANPAQRRAIWAALLHRAGQPLPPALNTL